MCYISGILRGIIELRDVTQLLVILVYAQKLDSQSRILELDCVYVQEVHCLLP